MNKKNGVKKFLVEDRQKSQSIVQPLEGFNVVTGEECRIDAAVPDVSSFWNNDEGLEEILRVSKEVTALRQSRSVRKSHCQVECKTKCLWTK
ncbi:hypothetical protein H2248_008953 [Termitomyces sp. 'cryptogamus']|nr:hypothetical protein H2248_008953 [Termitomyces sp. 'cryptogamus']